MWSPKSSVDIERRPSPQNLPTNSSRSHGRTKSLSALTNFNNAMNLNTGSSGGPGFNGAQPMSPSTRIGSPIVGQGALSSGGAGVELQWAEIQARTFCRWLNKQLESQGLEPMVDVVNDFSDGVKLIQEIISEESLGRYVKSPRLRVQKAENAAKALNFIRSKGIKLTNIGPEDIVDGNSKLILGMIWTLILRFTIANITESGLSARDGLLLWCQRKTASYNPDIDVQNFKSSFVDGLALCALIHYHRPELLDFNRLDKTDKRTNTELAFKVAEEKLGIPRLLEVKDLCDVEVPDERSVMTYVAEFFHKFSSEVVDKAETGARRVEKFAELMQGVWANKNDFETRLALLLSALATTEQAWSISPTPESYPDAKAHLAQFNEYKRTLKREWVKERQELAALYSNIQTKIRTYALKEWEPKEGLGLEYLEKRWAEFLGAETARSRAINGAIRDIKEALKESFAQAAEDFVQRLQQIEQAIGSLSGPLPEQRETLSQLSSQIPRLRDFLKAEITALNTTCLQAKVEENDYTVLTVDDLDYELELAEAGLKKKMAFIDNQMVSAQHTNITPAKLEEFEGTFKHFAWEETNTLGMWEMHSALASLGIVYAEEELETIFVELEQRFGCVTYEAWLSLLVDITQDDASSPEQLREAFRGMAAEKPYVTDLDFEYAHLPKETMKYLKEAMPVEQGELEELEEGMERPVQEGQNAYDYNAFLESAFLQ
ncbi:hypothetical protein I350_00645 [Cryptococcus amylolentus CBS 6273]|uniref:Calponin-homology (CH) domain-containing protein n=1 Tax=Cryptococcus amylolentus CBS 6273 TaxID=1296118 RepID=A0A1E3KFJ4_9TREE|nr:hypothetical protein I350_00645 [Cryptococcus amylolentus CBS 6273]